MEEFGQDCYKFFFVCLVEFPREAIRSWTFICGEIFFLIPDTISLVVIGPSSFFLLFLLDSHLVGSMFLETCPFLLGCPVCWHIIVYSIFLFIYFCISAVLIVISTLSFLILFTWILSFFLTETCQRFVDLVYPFKKNPAFGFIDFFSFLKSLYFIYFLSVLYYFLPSDDFRFCSSFSNSLGGRLCFFKFT